MSNDRGLTDLAATLADGQAVDWAALEAELGSEAERAIFRQLRVIADIAELHRSAPEFDGLDESALTATPFGDTTPTSPPPSSMAVPPVYPDDEPDLGTWGPYRLLRSLGPGTLGHVVRATDHLHRDVVVRFLPDASGPEVAAAFLATGQTLARIRHPNAVEVYGAEQHDDRTGLVMEFVDGRSLDQVVVTQGTFSAREAALVGWELCRAVSALHREGLAHGLLSPDNIVREAGGRLVLMDVWPQGVPIDALDMQAGTLPFMAPEVTGGAPPSSRSDVYSLGVVLYYLVSGAFPVRASSLADLTARYVRGERMPLADLRPDLPDDFIRIVERASDPDPERRYPTIAAVKEALSRTLGWDTWTRKPPVVASGARAAPADSSEEMAADFITPVAPPSPRHRQALPLGLIAVAVAAISIGGFVAWSLLPRGTALRGHSTSIATAGASADRGAASTANADVRLALGSAAGADPALTPLVIEQFARDLSSSPPFLVIAPVAVEPMLGQPAAAIMHAVDADVYVEVAVSRRESGVQARLDIFRVGAAEPQSLVESMPGVNVTRELTATLTQRVLEALKTTDAGVRPSLRTELPLANPEAMQAYMLGQTRLGRGGRKDVEEAADAFRRATESAPEFVLAYALWAEALLSRYRHNALRADEALPVAESVISKALSLDDRSAEAYAALGDLYAERHNHQQSERNFRRALELNPSCEYARIRYAMLLAGQGRVGEAVEQVDRAQKLNPRSSLLRGYLGATLHYARRFDEAARTYETLLRLDSQYTAAYIGLCKAYTELRRTDDALAACRSVGAQQAAEDPFVLSQLVKIHHDAGLSREARQALLRLRALYDDRPSGDGAFWIALAYVSLGEAGRALEWLDKAIDANSSRLAYARVDSRLDPIRRDPRFIARMARLEAVSPSVVAEPRPVTP